MAIFTIYNPVTKHIAEEREFQDYQKADRYCREQYGEGYISGHEPFHFNDGFRKMLKEGTHDRIKTNIWGERAAIISEDEKSIYHCGKLTIGELLNIRAAGIEIVNISKVEFINLHNSLV